MKAVIELDVPEWQIGQDVSVYFPDTMLKHGRCELLKEREPVKPVTEHHLFLCPVCKITLFREQKFCNECGNRIEWKGKG